ncbi:MAG: carbon storage regulator CsrA [Clostridium sp.]|nr:carbon storage regulator CsrA [Clostridium sp.]MDU7085280.1 carbon storage regulator CsrA [Clostridium sp.]
MLVITRRKEESILIGDNVEITVIKLEDGSVKLGINAPKDVTILRKEVYEKVKEENMKAMNSSLDLSKLLK